MLCFLSSDSYCPLEILCTHFLLHAVTFPRIFATCGIYHSSSWMWIMHLMQRNRYALCLLCLWACKLASVQSFVLFVFIAHFILKGCEESMIMKIWQTAPAFPVSPLVEAESLMCPIAQPIISLKSMAKWRWTATYCSHLTSWQDRRPSRAFTCTKCCINTIGSSVYYRWLACPRLLCWGAIVQCMHSNNIFGSITCAFYTKA